MFLMTKHFTIFRPEYDQFQQEILQFPILERCYTELNEVLFKLGYIAKYHPDDTDRLEATYQRATTLNNQITTNWGILLGEILRRLLGGSEFTVDQITEFFSDKIQLGPETVEISVSVLSENRELLAYLDDAVEDDSELKLYPGRFYRFKADSYNDAIESYFPEMFPHDIDATVGKDDDAVYCHNVTFQTSENCNLNCTYCLAPGTKILMSDFTEKPIEEIQVGDVVLGCNEHLSDERGQRKLIPTEVIELYQRHTDSIYRITSPWLKDDLTVTGNHPVLTSRGWVEVKDLVASDKLVVSMFDVNDYYDTDITSLDYIKGYFLAGFMGDGTVGQYHDNDGYTRHFMRFVVKDDEMNQRMREYGKSLGFSFHDYDFKISTKYNVTRAAIISRKRSDYELYQKLYDENMTIGRVNQTPEFLMGFAAGIYDAEGSNSSAPRFHNTDTLIIYMIERALSFLKIKWTYDRLREGVNRVGMTLRITDGINGFMKFIKSAKPAIVRKGLINYFGKSMFRTVSGFTSELISEGSDVYNFATTEHTYIANGIVVHNCYQGNKSASKMTFEIGKTFIDKLLAGEYSYVNEKNSPALILEFIGGDPFMEMPLTRKLYEYFLERCYQLDHPWFEFHRVSLCSNGLLYFDREVQAFFADFYPKISFNISIDGNRELHDACRIQPNGEGSYEVDMAALKHYCENFADEKNSKMTLAPSNIKYLFESVVDFIDQGMTVINLNCVFEEGWTAETAALEYEQLKLLANYILENDLERLFIAIFSDQPDDIWDMSFDGNFCGGLGSMLSIGPDGTFYPCLRYMPSSIGDDTTCVTLGHIETGLERRDGSSETLKLFGRITRRTQSNDICYNCPIASGCAWCSACCHQSNGTANRRTTFHCIQTIAESLANVYYWNLLNIKKPEYNLGVRKNNVPDEWALKIISEDELEYLKAIENRSAIATIDHASEVG